MNNLKNTNKTFILILFSLIILSLFSACSNNTKTTNNPNFQEINGFTFIKMDDGLWYTQLQSPITKQTLNVPFRNSPQDTKDILVDVRVPEKILNSNKVYLTTDPNSSSSAVVAMLEIGRILGTKYHIINIPTGSALTRQSENKNVSVPIITCDNATDTTRVILFKEDTTTAAYVQDNCVIFSAKNDDELIKLADKVTFILLKII